MGTRYANRKTKMINFFKADNASWDDITISGISFIIAGLFAIICVTPFIYVIKYSITPYEEYLQNPFSLILKNPTLNAYKMAMDYRYIWTGYKNTLFIALIGTICSMALLVMTAYPLTKRNLKGRKMIMVLWIITMFFGGGMIPNYFLIRNLGLLNNLWSIILPSLLGTYNLILMINYISGLPTSIEEAALIDGANDVQTLFKIILPLCLPILATLGLFTVVGYWNTYFTAIIYLTKRDKWPLQLVLREIVFESAAAEMQHGMAAEERITQPFTLKMSSIVIATLPIMCVYPFLQKYFMTGLVLGGVKE
ncbi:MAG: carbohydrate ABC transporter permease [Clostridiales bacterium]|nr:carbohydrate ABC transporter permease [Clostridiales bacterium]